MTIGISTDHGRQGRATEEATRSVSWKGTWVATLSVPAGAYIITATCNLNLFAGTQSVVWALALSLGEYSDFVYGKLSPFVNDWQVGAMTMGAKVSKRSNIRLRAGIEPYNGEVLAVSPSVTAVQVDELYLTRLPPSRSELFSQDLRTMAELKSKLISKPPSQTGAGRKLK